MRGTIKKLVNEKHFGFILGEDGTERFFHSTSLKSVRFENLKEGQAVLFEPTQTPKGHRAEDVRVSG